MTHEHDHGIDHSIGTPEQRSRRFAAAGILRMASAGVQLWGGVTGSEGALLAEAAEEVADAGAFVGASVEAKTEQRGISRRWRNRTIGLAGAAVLTGAIEAGHEIISEAGEWREPLSGLDMSTNVHRAAAAAVLINSGVMVMFRHGKDSKKASDRFAFRDAVKDFAIPGGVLLAAGLKAPHLAEFAIEGGGALYGINNVRKLWQDWRADRIINDPDNNVVAMSGSNNTYAPKPPEPPHAA